MEGRFSVGLVIGTMLSIPLWVSAIGWMRLAGSAVEYLFRHHII
ncbi:MULTISPECIES: hypothetical protein [Paenibacillus]|uniref:Uncharacterized protein n=1 Tax=Paenibacillus oleatilyticus TaxID=2594886 RepID=A0ABV4V1U2_9BACL|nr:MULTISPECIES: hypothetical protein [Paenibacillus]GLI08785.1 hypothetical protein YDYSG_48170 [Paenibacillus tyrfis]GMX61607.1 hypothetical protein Elgi_14110 [Paenibacillus elgii]